LFTIDPNLDSIERELIVLRIEHSDLDFMIDSVAHRLPGDDLILKRLKKKRLTLRDKIARLESALIPDGQA
jgi:hypothetical protein